MGEQNTGGTDQASRDQNDLPLYANQIQRQREIAQLKRLNILFWLWFSFYGITFTIGLYLCTQFLPEPIKIWAILLLGFSMWAHGQVWRSMIDQKAIKSDHYWQNEIDQMVTRIMEGLHENDDRIDQALDQSDREIAAIVAEAFEHIPRRRTPGRRPLTEQEIAHELARADRAAAEIEAQGRTPTQQEIAQRLGIAPKTLQRYRGRMDNKGQK